MKQRNLLSFFTFVLTASIFAASASAGQATVAAQPAMFNLSQVAAEEPQPVPKDDDPEMPDEGYECEQIFPFCEANRRDVDNVKLNIR